MQPPFRGATADAPAATPASTADVPVLHLPADDVLRLRLDRIGLPRVLAVAERAEPPVPAQPIEDWVRAPVDPVELEERRTVVLDRYLRATQGVRIDGDGLLRVSDRWAALTDRQWAVLFPLVNQLGRPVARAVVEDGYRAAGGADGRSLVALLRRQRPRLAALGLELHLLSNGAFLLVRTPGSDIPVH